jgi:hypothetical protein
MSFNGVTFEFILHLEFLERKARFTDWLYPDTPSSTSLPDGPTAIHYNIPSTGAFIVMKAFQQHRRSGRKSTAALALSLNHRTRAAQRNFHLLESIEFGVLPHAAKQRIHIRTRTRTRRHFITSILQRRHRLLLLFLLLDDTHDHSGYPVGRCRF